MMYPLSPEVLEGISEVEQAAKACLFRQIRHGSPEASPDELARLKRAMRFLTEKTFMVAINDEEI